MSRFNSSGIEQLLVNYPLKKDFEKYLEEKFSLLSKIYLPFIAELGNFNYEHPAKNTFFESFSRNQTHFALVDFFGVKWDGEKFIELSSRAYTSVRHFVSLNIISQINALEHQNLR